MLRPQWALALFVVLTIGTTDLTRATAQPTAVTEAPKKAVAAYIQQGDRAFAEGDFQGAVAAYTQALQIFNLSDYSYYNRGNAYRRLKDYSNAIADYTQSITLNPQNTFAYLYRGMALQASNQSEAAIADYTTLIKINDKDPVPYLQRAEALTSLKQQDAAMSDLKKAAALYKAQGESELSEKVLSQIRSR